MTVSAEPVSLTELRPWRERYRVEMNCQVVHDSLHGRAGWTRSHWLHQGDRHVGYGSLAVGGPWKDTRTIFEFYLEPELRSRSDEAFAAFVAATEVTHLLAQTNDPLLAPRVQRWARDVVVEAVLFRDEVTTHLPSQGAVCRKILAEDEARIFRHEAEPVGDQVLEFEGEIVATGGVLYHYNPPYGDVFMEVAAPYRRRGFGAFLVQELKRACRTSGRVPSARCHPANVASRQTCLKAGFAVCGQRVSGKIAR